MIKKEYVVFTVVVILCVFGTYLYTNKGTVLGGTSVVTTTASSSAVILTTTSQRLVATSSKRFALSIQPIYCTAGGTVFLELENPGSAAIAPNGLAVLASTTEIITDNDLQAPTNAVQGIVNAGTCTVIVNEWFSSF